jgi:ADP-dependent phosphofructokinase/glucokinase
MSISLMDILNTESSLSEKILGDNNAPITVCINGTCSMFNKMTAEDITQHREEYYIQYLPVKIEETIES